MAYLELGRGAAGGGRDLVAIVLYEIATDRYCERNVRSAIILQSTEESAK